jgi:hypothetical protein
METARHNPEVLYAELILTVTGQFRRPFSRAYHHLTVSPP